MVLLWVISNGFLLQFGKGSSAAERKQFPISFEHNVFGWVDGYVSNGWYIVASVSLTEIYWSYGNAGGAAYHWVNYFGLGY